MRCCKSLHGGVEGNQVAPTSRIFNYILKRQWSSLVFATFMQNFIIHIHLMLSNNYFVLSTYKHSQYLHKMQSSLTFSVRGIDCVLTPLITSCFDKWHLGRSLMLISVQCKSGIEWRFCPSYICCPVNTNPLAVSRRGKEGGPWVPWKRGSLGVPPWAKGLPQASSFTTLPFAILLLQEFWFFLGQRAADVQRQWFY